MSPDEFERIAAPLGMAEDWIKSAIDLARVHRAHPDVIGAIEDAYRLVIAAHAAAQLELEAAPEPFDWPACPLCGRPLNVCHREGCTALRQPPASR